MAGRHSYRAVLAAIASTLVDDENIDNRELWQNLVWDVVVEKDFVIIDTCFDTYNVTNPIDYLFGSIEKFNYWKMSRLGLKLNGWKYHIDVNIGKSTTDIIIRVNTAITLNIATVHKMICSEMTSDDICTVEEIHTITYHSPRRSPRININPQPILLQ